MLICQLNPTGANTTASALPSMPAMLYSIGAPVAPGGGSGKLASAHSNTVSTRMMPPTRRMKISTRCHRPMAILRGAGQW